MRRRVGFLAATAAVLLVASACIPGPPEAPTPSYTDQNGLQWRDCSDQARDENPALGRDKTVECTTVTVPQDWDNPGNGETFGIAVMRIYTGELDDKIGSVLTNPGGPGGSGLSFLPYWVQPPDDGPAPDGLLDDFVLVGFDPRGVGESNPVDCISDADLDAAFGAEPDPVSQEAFDEVVAINQRIADGCGAAYGEDLRLFATVQAARDMDAIRAALGDEKLTYLGYSYGTLLGAVYAQLFPDHIRALVLDGAVDPTADSIEASEGQAMGFERALTNFSDWCQGNPAQCPISANPRGAITQQLERARTSPVTGADGRQATSGWVLYGVLLTMYAQDYWQYLGPAIDNLRNGDPRLIFALADSYADRDPTGHYSNQFDAFNAINCADSGDYPSMAEMRELQDQWRDEYPMFGTALATGLITCAVWPGDRDPFPAGPAVGAPPIVVVGTLGDPATPYESTQRLADMLGVGVVLTWEGEGHTAYPETSCIRRAVENYLIDLIVPDEGTRCPA